MSIEDNNLPPPQSDDFGLPPPDPAADDSDAPPNARDERVPPAFDAAQWALHGVLRAYVESESGKSEARLQAAMGRVKSTSRAVNTTLSGQLLKVIRFRWFTRGVILAAACLVLILVSIPLLRTPTAMADLFSDAANAGTGPLRLLSRTSLDGAFGLLLEPDSPAARASKDELTQVANNVLEGARRYERNPADGADINVFCDQWQAYHVLLRDLGRRDDAVREAQAAIEFSKHQNDQPFLHIFTDGLGNIHAAFGEYADARRAFEDSIRIRRTLSRVPPPDLHIGEPGYEGHIALDIAPMYLRLMSLAIAEGDLNGARKALARAELPMHQRITTICESNKLSVQASATLWDAWVLLGQARNDEYRRPENHDYSPDAANWPKPYPPGPPLPAWVRTIVYHEAVLLREEGDFAAAQVALDRAATIADYSDSGEFRLPFLENLEAARLAIIRKDYLAALTRVQVAEVALSNPTFVPGSSTPSVNRLPPAPLRIAELNALKGIALLGQDRANVEGKRLLNLALSVVHKLAESRGPDERRAFLKQFESWQSLVDRGEARQP